MLKVLVIEDVAHMRRLLKGQLEEHGFHVDEAADLKNAVRKIRESVYDIFVMDLLLPDGKCISLLDRFPNETSSRSIIITANPSTSSVVEAIKKGAFNYLEKPVDIDLLVSQIEKVVQLNRLKSRYQSVIDEATDRFTFKKIIFESKQMEAVVSRAEVLAGTGNTILIHGETGVGKEVLSQAIHYHSPRREQVFLPLNCAAIPAELFESELFGFEKGAFTGAESNYSGRFIQADKGTLFLDEIGELPMAIQAKLLRILDERRIYRLKSKNAVDIDVRLIAATNRNLFNDVKTKEFRGDLYYRLQESVITIPPLRERQEDILPLFRHFLGIYNQLFNKEVHHINRDAEHLLVTHRWQGNIRELKNTVKSIIPFKTNDTIDVDDLSSAIVGGGKEMGNKVVPLEENIKDHIVKVIKIAGFNLTRAAELLGISRSRLYRNIDRYGLKHLIDQERPGI
ncbi:MAG: sigma-54-dependent Fis family transcriptional regulator [bacterium]|nr:sigma-54-dependent Fis family transcriptional regulator [bacterium]